MEISKMTKEEIPYISVKVCPVCGESPEKVTEGLEGPNGRGYRGCRSYQYRCDCCKLVRGTETTDIYVDREVAQNNAKKSWNDEVDRITAHLRKHWIPA